MNILVGLYERCFRVEDNKQTNQTNNVQRDPKTGELVGNLKGLRELMRVKEETEVAKTDRRKGRRRNRKNDRTKSTNQATQRDGKPTIPEAVDQDDKSAVKADTPRDNEQGAKPTKATKTAETDESAKLQLPQIDTKSVLYAEVELDEKQQSKHIMFYLDDAGQVVVYKDILFAGERRTKFLNTVYNQLESSADLFPRGTYDGTKVYVNTNQKIVLGYSSLIYDDHFQLKSSSAELYNYVRQIKSTSHTAGDKHSAKKSDKSLRLTIEQSIKLSQIIGKDNYSIDNVVEAIGILGEASTELLMQLYGTGDHMADKMTISDVICELRMDQILGAQTADGKYEVLRTDSKALDEGRRRRNQHPRESFLSIIRPTKASNKLIIYDLATLDNPKPADEFMVRLAKLCDKTDNTRIRALFANKSTITVNASQILSAISSDSDGFKSIDDYAEFHNIITKYMLSSGWASYFPALLANTEGIQYLAVDLIRYALANQVWIKSIYDQDVITMMTNGFLELPITNVSTAKPLKVAIEKAYTDIAEAQPEGDQKESQNATE